MVCELDLDPFFFKKEAIETIEQLQCATWHANRLLQIHSLSVISKKPREAKRVF